MDDNQLKSVAGLVDTSRVAELLSVEPARIRTWVARKGKVGGGRIPDLFPSPISEDGGGADPGLLNRGFIWRRDDIIAFSKVFAEYKPAGGRQKDKS